MTDKPASVFDRDLLGLTLGILLGVTLVAFEALAIVTIAPSIANAYGRTDLYGWIFSGFMLASLLGTVLGGQQADAHGPGRPFAAGLGLFAAGLLISGFAPSMALFLLGRVVQGLGGGATVVALYAAVNVAYSDDLRPRVVALMSSAWVVPALVGPAAAGFVAESLGWRVVFWGLVPLLLAAFVLAMPHFRRQTSERKGESSPVLAAAGLVLGTGILLWGLSLTPWIFAAVVAVPGGAVALRSLKPLTPEGTFRLRAGLPSVIAARGLFYAAFVGVQVFLTLMLVDVHGFSATLAGIAIALGSVSWTAGSWVQDRLENRSGSSRRHLRILAGTGILGVGLALQLLALFTPVLPFLLTSLSWMIAGLGTGLAHSSSSVLAFALAPKGEEGAVSSGLQLADQFTSAVSTGVGGALFAYAERSGAGQQLGVAYAFGFSLLLVCLGVWAAYRIGWSRAPQVQAAD